MLAEVQGASIRLSGGEGGGVHGNSIGSMDDGPPYSYRPTIGLLLLSAALAKTARAVVYSAGSRTTPANTSR